MHTEAGRTTDGSARVGAVRDDGEPSNGGWADGR